MIIIYIVYPGIDGCSENSQIIEFNLSIFFQPHSIYNYSLITITWLAHSTDLFIIMCVMMSLYNLLPSIAVEKKGNSS